MSAQQIEFEHIQAYDSATVVEERILRNLGFLKTAIINLEIPTISKELTNPITRIPLGSTQTKAWYIEGYWNEDNNGFMGTFHVLCENTNSKIAVEYISFDGATSQLVFDTEVENQNLVLSVTKPTDTPITFSYQVIRNF